jgi:hypothetical protein
MRRRHSGVASFVPMRDGVAAAVHRDGPEAAVADG